MTEPTVIDTMMHGLPGITAAFLVKGEKTALVETGPRSSIDHVLGGLQHAGVDRLDWIVVTHIHLDHAGAAGTIARRYPEARVAVHPVGAPHLADPSKLWKSAARIYGERMESLWGGIDPIAEDRIEAIEDGAKIDLGGRSLEAVETPGHAYHHHAFLDDASGAVFTGDALGVRLPDVGVVRPATPPPEFHLTKGLASIDRIAALSPESLWPTHFGPHNVGSRVKSVEDLCQEAKDSLRTWEGWVKDARTQTTELDDVARLVQREARAALEAEFDDRSIDRMNQTTSYWMNTWGYMRYLDKEASA